jgi:hypothetical protein
MTQWEKYIEYLKKWTEEHSSEANMGMSPVCFDEWEENEDCEGDKNRKILAKITWRIQDIIDSFKDDYKREPTDDELDRILDNYCSESCEDGSISYGWEYIYQAIEEAMSNEDEEE